jgi:hypothetical protein
MVERRKDIQLWHQRLAHLKYRDVLELSNSDVVEGMNVTRRLSSVMLECWPRRHAGRHSLGSRSQLAIIWGLRLPNRSLE